jgi:hypothetical protein
MQDRYQKVRAAVVQLFFKDLHPPLGQLYRLIHAFSNVDSWGYCLLFSSLWLCMRRDETMEDSGRPSMDNSKAGEQVRDKKPLANQGSGFSTL